MSTINPRSTFLEQLRTTPIWDIVIIGGGASGLGAAVEAASRGYKTLLLEAHDFAKGTSSRSTKLVHGGVRYLAQGNIGLVREALRERGLMRKNAPHLVHDMSFVVPAYDWWAGPFYGVGLKMYDLLAGKLNLGGSKYLGKEETLRHTPTLQGEGLRGGILYHDGQFDDARLAVTLMRTVLDHGGVTLNYLPVTGLLKEEGKVCGATARDSESGQEFTVRARAVVNATGVFVDQIRRMDEPGARDMLSPSQGVHVVVDKRFLPGDSAIMIPRTEDGRVLFAVPWHDHVVIGTTDTAVPHASLEPRALPEEIEFILRTAGQYMNPAPTRADVKSVYVGLRPLVKAETSDGVGSTAQLSRDHVLRVAPSGLITLTGGKWTTYRHMGEDAIDRAAEVGALPTRLSLTQGLRLHGWTETPEAAPLDVYGTDAAHLRQLAGAETALHPELPYLEAEVRWAARCELARTVEDVLSRRTRALLLNARASEQAALRVAQLLAEELGHDAHWIATQVAQFRELARGYQLDAVAEPDLSASS
ncbi:glycerol-3-phosphate dehydrogenase/oxidase [Deinococcus peraridilitoris]|uniref:Glycerol-3-phosphate dehydrogenase n=1 Tax=Deinococcus peraridilitoris (strain DSM 19664 / LMG 22246 / CIP 109416 / KR-200) TaxID=937777 RepID=L0A3I1_DEIPD|nr:glycerol-3-phosphate dehydrogenase/oxidase [Deinococcus peraridilitoris]AFZ67994.1 glycerol-3-phosphate dehydrogenase [Deinococcus peraridilitoris DSM 19664]